MQRENNRLVGGFSAYKWSAWLRVNREMDLGRTSQYGTPKETNMKIEEGMLDQQDATLDLFLGFEIFLQGFVSCDPANKRNLSK